MGHFTSKLGTHTHISAVKGTPKNRWWRLQNFCRGTLKKIHRWRLIKKKQLINASTPSLLWNFSFLLWKKTNLLPLAARWCQVWEIPWHYRPIWQSILFELSNCCPDEEMKSQVELQIQQNMYYIQDLFRGASYSILYRKTITKVE